MKGCLWVGQREIVFVKLIEQFRSSVDKTLLCEIVNFIENRKHCVDVWCFLIEQL